MPAIPRPLGFEDLKQRQRALRAGFPDVLGLRVHRALSWLARAERCEDEDGAFIFLWIAFNAAYADDRAYAEAESARAAFETFFMRVVERDAGGLIRRAIWTTFPGPIRVLLDNHFVYKRFWDFQNQLPGCANWEEAFEKSRAVAHRALQNGDTVKVLTVLFDRLYVLRNQLVHGGAPWESEVNRAQVGDGCRILGTLVPHFIAVMMDAPEADWGAPHYPVVEPA